MSTFFSHLECAVPCGAGPRDPTQAHHRCSCGAPLLARYDLTAARRWSKSAIPGREPSMWRYRELLPLLQSARGLDPPVTLGEGWTPLVRARRLGAAAGLKRIYIKDEGRNPTGSFKARGMAAALTRALHLGARVIVAGGSGHASLAAAAYAARAAIQSRIVLPADVRPPIPAEVGQYGAELSRVDGSVADAERAAADAATSDATYDLSAFQEPYRIEGKKTIGYELAEQLGWELPDWIICPAASGVAFVGIWKALTEMAALGWVDPVRRPHMVAVQAAGCAPVVRAVAASADQAEPWGEVRTMVGDLRVADSPGAALVLRAIRESRGTALGVGDTEMAAEMKALARLEGVSAAPGGGAALHAVRVLAGDGRIKPHDTVVIINPGTASGYVE